MSSTYTDYYYFLPATSNDTTSILSVINLSCRLGQIMTQHFPLTIAFESNIDGVFLFKIPKECKTPTKPSYQDLSASMSLAECMN